MNVVIRKADIDELDVLVRWRMRALHEVFPTDANEDRSVIRKNNEEYYKKHVPAGTYTACFAQESTSGNIVGCGGVCYHEEMPSPDNVSGTNGYLMNIYTIPEIRGQGVGRSIVEFLIDDARSKGVEKIYLESSHVAKRLYGKIGFVDMIDYMKL